MENSSKALIIVGGMLIALLVISIGAYIILSSSNVSEKFDENMSESEIEKFNAKFEKYRKQSYYINDSENIVYEDTVKGKPDEYNNYSFTNYNSASDVVSAIDLAVSVDKSMNYDIAKGVQVVIIGINSFKDRDGNLKNIQFKNLNGSVISNTPKAFGITPLVQMHLGRTKKDSKIMYRLDDFININKPQIKSTSSTQEPNNIIRGEDTISVNEFLKYFSDSKMNNKKRVYEYGFDGEVYTNSSTGMIENIVFTLKVNYTY